MTTERRPEHDPTGPPPADDDEGAVKELEDDDAPDPEEPLPPKP